MKDVIKVANVIEVVSDESGEFSARDKVDLLKYSVKTGTFTTDEAIELVCKYGIQLTPEEY